MAMDPDSSLRLHVVPSLDQEPAAKANAAASPFGLESESMVKVKLAPSFPVHPGWDLTPVSIAAFEVHSRSEHTSQVGRRKRRSYSLWKDLFAEISARRHATERAIWNRGTLHLNDAWRHASHVIWPTSRRMQTWDLLILVTLVYTFLITPFQVAFLLQTPLEIFVLNRVVDGTLAVDMVIQLFLAYQLTETSATSSALWVTNLHRIRLHYLKTWFIFDLVGLLSSFVEIWEVAGGTATRSARALQAVRFARLFRLGRVFVRARSVLTLLMAKAPTQVGFLFTEFLTWLFKLIMLAHIVACVFGFIATAEETSEEGATSWLKAAEASKNLHIDRDHPHEMYLMALYWAYTTLLTIGYGDITPQTIIEHAVCIVIMVAGGLAWTLLMAATCSLATASDAERLHHGMNMETLVRMCTDHHFPPDLTRRLVLFLVKSKRMEILVGQRRLMDRMSPALQSEVAVHCTASFLRGVEFFQGTEKGFITALASSLRLQIFPPKEWIVPPELSSHVRVTTDCRDDRDDGELVRKRSHLTESSECAGPRVLRGFLDPRRAPHLTILEGGLTVLGHIRCSGSSWHRDLILSEPCLRNQEVAHSIVFCSVYMLAREVLFATLVDPRFPVARSRVKLAAVNLAFVRTVTRCARIAADFGYDLRAAAAHVVDGHSSGERFDWDVMASEKGGVGDRELKMALQETQRQLRALKQHQEQTDVKVSRLLEQGDSTERKLKEAFSLLTQLASTVACSSTKREEGACGLRHLPH